MAHKISMKRARMFREKELKLQQMQRDGKPLPKSMRRQKKYLMQVKKQKGFIKYLIARRKMHGDIDGAKKLEKTL